MIHQTIIRSILTVFLFLFTLAVSGSLVYVAFDGNYLCSVGPVLWTDTYINSNVCTYNEYRETRGKHLLTSERIGVYSCLYECNTIHCNSNIVNGSTVWCQLGYSDNSTAIIHTKLKLRSPYIIAALTIPLLSILLFLIHYLILACREEYESIESSDDE